MSNPETPALPTAPNYTISRGKVLIDGRYIGNTPTFTFVVDEKGFYKCLFKTDNISAENLKMFFMGKHTVEVSYRAENPKGANINMGFFGVLEPHQNIVKNRDDWQTLDFIISIEHTTTRNLRPIVTLDLSQLT